MRSTVEEARPKRRLDVVHAPVPGRSLPAELDRPLVPSRSHVVDHVAISFPDLDPVLVRLEARGVPIIEGPYPFGETRAVLLEDLDRMALELIEAGS